MSRDAAVHIYLDGVRIVLPILSLNCRNVGNNAGRLLH
jgi:hypothetical protein